MIPPAPKRVCYPPIERERHEWKGHIEATVTSSCSRLARFEICASDLSFRPPLTVPPPPIHRTPYVTGTTVLGMKYKDGVMIACDTLGTSMEDTFG